MVSSLSTHGIGKKKIIVLPRNCCAQGRAHFKMCPLRMCPEWRPPPRLSQLACPCLGGNARAGGGGLCPAVGEECCPGRLCGALRACGLGHDGLPGAPAAWVSGLCLLHWVCKVLGGQHASCYTGTGSVPRVVCELEAVVILCWHQRNWGF